MAGLLGMGGAGGLLGQGYGLDPVQQQLMRNYALKSALIGAGASLMNPDPRMPPSFSASLGRAGAGGLNAFQQAEGNFINQRQDAQNYARNEQLMQATAEEESQKRMQRDAQNQWIGALPPDKQGFARANPEMAAKGVYSEMYPSANGDKYGLQQVWARDKSGKWRIFQANQHGGLPAEMVFPEGVEPQPGVSMVDTGTGTQPVTTKGGIPYGAPIEKDVAGVESEKARGDAIASYRSMTSKMPGLEKVVAELDGLAEKATYTEAGKALDYGMKQFSMAPREEAIARSRYISMVDNQILPLLRDTFGAQFTEREGASLRATLGDPDKTPQEKQAVLRSFIEQKRRDVEALAIQAAVGPGGAQQNAPASGLTQNPDGSFNWAP